MAKKKLVEPKPKNDAYTTMLLFTFLAIVIGCVLMFLDGEAYKEGPPPAASPALTLPKLGTPMPPSTAAPAVPAPAEPVPPVAPAGPAAPAAPAAPAP